ncbi:MAG: TldD/PmbA family protein [Ruminococcaceae bacterium]|nr:TldD/PmbA family protein [Oscillospiraceae bacterium]
MDKLCFVTEQVIEKLKDSGADMAYCTASSGETREFNVEGGEFTLFRTLFDNSLTLTAFIDGKKGSVGLNSFDEEKIDEAVENCIAAARSSTPDSAWALAPGKNEKSFKNGAVTPDLDLLFDRTKELLETIERDYPLIVMEQMIVAHENAHSVYRNSNGALYTKQAGYYNFDLMYSAHEGEEGSSFFSTGVITDNLDRPAIELGSIAKDLSDVQKQIHTVPTEGKFTGTMLLSPSCFGEFISEIAGNFASDSPILEGTSIWKDALGTMVADERITVSFNPSEKEIVCGQSYTTEGFVAEDFDFIKNGRLESFLVSLYVSNKTGVERAKNSGGSMVIAPGDRSLDEIIAGIGKGILVGRFSGGSPANNGDFSGVAKNSFLIENGKIKCAVSETMIAGNLADMLKNLVAISKERMADGYSLLPYAAFDGITVSGK